MHDVPTFTIMVQFNSSRSRRTSLCSSKNARKITGSVGVCFITVLFAFVFCSHRMIAFQQNHRTLVKSPLNEIERTCPGVSYDTVGHKRSDAGKICMTTLTDARRGDYWQRLIRWRDFDATLQMSWPNKLNYCLKHRYMLYDESKKSLDTSRPPAWSKITSAKRLLTEENCDWVFWLDADTVIMNSQKRIEDFLPTKNSTIDLVITHEKGKSWNSGAFLMRKSDWSLKLLDDWWSMTDYVLAKGQADAGDNRALKTLLQNMNRIEYDEKVAAPPRCQFNSVAKFFTPSEAAKMTPDDLTHNKRLFLNEENYHKGDLIAHVAGVNNKITTMQMLLEDAQ